MSTTQKPLVGDILELEQTDDVNATAPTWNVVAHTADSVELSPNTENAEMRQHESEQMDKAAVSEAWELSFSKKFLTGSAGLSTLHLLGPNNELKGSADTRKMAANAPALRVTAYASREDRDAGNVKWQVQTDNYLLIRGSGELNVEEFALIEFVIHSRARPVRTDLS